MIRLARIDLNDRAIADEVLRLQRKAHKIEADLIGSDAIPLQEILDELQACTETFLATIDDGEIVAAIHGATTGARSTSTRLVVRPDHFRRRIGTLLVRAALEAGLRAERAIVQTGAKNGPARTLYLREGFQHTDDIEVAPQDPRRPIHQAIRRLVGASGTLVPTRAREN